MITIVEYNKQAKTHVILTGVNWREFKPKPDHLYWWDLNNSTREETSCLLDFFHFHPLAIQDCVADVHYPKLDFYETYIYLVIHGVDADRSTEEGFVPKELDVFLSQDFLVTYHKREMRSIAEVMQRLRDDSPMFDYGVDFILYEILNVLVNNYLPVLDDLEERQDVLEEKIFENPVPQLLHDILHIKKTLMALKRTMFPQREVTNHLARNEYGMVQTRTQAYYRDIYDSLYRMTEMIESFRDISMAQVELYLSTVSNRMNEIMKVLTIAATIFMPLTVITGVYGMNFVHMPELRWHYGYPYVLAIMALVSLTMIAYFRWKKWV